MPNDITPPPSWNVRDGGRSERWSSDIGDRRVFVWQKLIISHHTCAGAYLHLSCYFWISQVSVRAVSAQKQPTPTPVRAGVVGNFNPIVLIRLAKSKWSPRCCERASSLHSSSFSNAGVSEAAQMPAEKAEKTVAADEVGGGVSWQQLLEADSLSARWEISTVGR